MTRKNALARLWWGGGKGVIARPAHAAEGELRRTLYREYGAFVSRLRGCYVTAEDVGTAPDDMLAIAAATRFVTCLPEAVGGRGNPAPMTAAGVACAIDAALDHLGMGPAAGRRFAVQGAGQVGSALVDELLRRAAGRIVVSESSPPRCAALRDAWRGRPVELRASPPGDASILAEPCDVLAPCALGGVLDAQTIPTVRARIVCGSANNPLADERRDAEHLRDRGIAFVPDFVANRMGIVFVSNEQYGRVRDDPEVMRHLDPSWEGGVQATTRRVLAEADARGVSPQAAALELADRLAAEEHPIFGHRGWQIVAGLCRPAV